MRNWERNKTVKLWTRKQNIELKGAIKLYKAQGKCRVGLITVSKYIYFGTPPSTILSISILYYFILHYISEVHIVLFTPPNLFYTYSYLLLFTYKNIWYAYMWWSSNLSSRIQSIQKWLHIEKLLKIITYYYLLTVKMLLHAFCDDKNNNIIFYNNITLWKAILQNG